MMLCVVVSGSEKEHGGNVVYVGVLQLSTHGVRSTTQLLNNLTHITSIVFHQHQLTKHSVECGVTLQKLSKTKLFGRMGFWNKIQNENEGYRSLPPEVRAIFHASHRICDH